jgi:hypothetical protein
LGGEEPYVEKVYAYIYRQKPLPLKPWPIKQMVRVIGHPDSSPDLPKSSSAEDDGNLNVVYFN